MVLSCFIRKKFSFVQHFILTWTQVLFSKWVQCWVRVLQPAPTKLAATCNPSGQLHADNVRSPSSQFWYWPVKQNTYSSTKIDFFNQRHLLYCSMQNHRTPLTMTVMLPQRTQESLVNHRHDHLVCSLSNFGALFGAIPKFSFNDHIASTKGINQLALSILREIRLEVMIMLLCLLVLTS